MLKFLNMTVIAIPKPVHEHVFFPSEATVPITYHSFVRIPLSKTTETSLTCWCSEFPQVRLSVLNTCLSIGNGCDQVCDSSLITSTFRLNFNIQKMNLQTDEAFKRSTQRLKCLNTVAITLLCVVITQLRCQTLIKHTMTLSSGQNILIKKNKSKKKETTNL